MKFLHILSGTTLSLLLIPVVAFAWSDPGSIPPNTQPVSFPPVNTSATGQDKSGPVVPGSPVLTLGSLSVFGNALIRATSYINWGADIGSTGYGFRSNAGVMQFKNSGGAWTNIVPVTNAPVAFQQYGFSNNSGWDFCTIPGLTNIICEVQPNLGSYAGGWTKETSTVGGGFPIGGPQSLAFKVIPNQTSTPWTLCMMNGYTTPYDHETRAYVVKKPDNKWYVYLYPMDEASQRNVNLAVSCWR